jgi:hypothetical protein
LRNIDPGILSTRGSIQAHSQEFILLTELVNSVYDHVNVTGLSGVHQRVVHCQVIGIGTEFLRKPVLLTVIAEPEFDNFSGYDEKRATDSLCWLNRRRNTTLRWA